LIKFTWLDYFNFPNRKHPLLDYRLFTCPST